MTETTTATPTHITVAIKKAYFKDGLAACRNSGGSKYNAETKTWRLRLANYERMTDRERRALRVVGSDKLSIYLEMYHTAERAWEEENEQAFFILRAHELGF